MSKLIAALFVIVCFVAPQTADAFTPPTHGVLDRHFRSKSCIIRCA